MTNRMEPPPKNQPHRGDCLICGELAETKVMPNGLVFVKACNACGIVMCTECGWLHDPTECNFYNRALDIKYSHCGVEERK